VSLDLDAAMQSVRLLRDGIRAKNPPPQEGGPSSDDNIVMFSLVRGTRTYLERIVHQINGCFENGWYDASAVMIRRLVETLIIEVYESKGRAADIKDANGDWLFLNDLIAKITADPLINLGRATKKSLPDLKDVGDKSAHSRYHTAHRGDIEKLAPHLRNVVQELLAQANLK
jgi:hypothetical protein